MSFAGITSDKQRADVIAYLRTLSDNPEPLPSPDQASRQQRRPHQPAGGATAAAAAPHRQQRNRRAARA